MNDFELTVSSLYFNQKPHHVLVVGQCDFRVRVTLSDTGLHCNEILILYFGIFYISQECNK